MDPLPWTLIRLARSPKARTKVAARKVAKARRVDGSLLATMVANMVVAKVSRAKARKVAKARKEGKARASLVAVEKEKEEVLPTTTPVVFVVNKDTGEMSAPAKLKL